MLSQRGFMVSATILTKWSLLQLIIAGVYPERVFIV